MSEPTSPRFSPQLLVVLAVLLWSTGGFFIKFTDLDSFYVNAGRSLLAAAVVGAISYRRGLNADRGVLLSAVLYAGTLICFVYATKNTTAANAIFLQYTAPIYILILSPLLLKERFHLPDLITVAACVGGMSLFFFDTNPDTESAPNVFAGNAVALLSGAFFGLYLMAVRRRRHLDGNPSISVFYGNLIVVAVMLPFLIKTPPAEISVRDVAAIVFLGVFQIGIAYLLFTEGIARGVRALDASIIGFLEPILNPLWVFLVLRERPGKWALVGGAVIIVAITFHNLRSDSRPAAETVPD